MINSNVNYPIPARFCAAVVIGLASVLGVAMPVLLVRSVERVRHRGGAKARLISLGNCFSAGLLVGMGALHFLPEAMEADMRRVPASGSHWEPTFTVVSLVIGLVFPILIDTVVFISGVTVSHGHSHEVLEAQPQPQHASTVILSCLLTYHGITEGVIVGLEGSTRLILSLLIPLSIHKFFDALVLGLRMAERPGTGRSLLADAGVLSTVLSTPLTIVCVTLFSNQKNASDSASSPSSMYVASQAIGAGSFLYIALADIFPLEFNRDRSEGNSPSFHRILQCVHVAMGILLVSSMSLIFPHKHD